MSLGSQDDFDAQDLALLEAARVADESDQQAAGTATQTEQKPEPTDTSTAAVTETAPATTTTEPAATTTTTTTEPQGDVRGALRAARRSERQARDEAARLKAELDELRTKVPQAQDASVTDAELAELDADMPIVAKALRETRAIKAALPTAAAPAPQAQPEFVPPVQADHVQDAIDAVPELLSMQNDPDQTAFQLAVKQDELLRASPKWASKPMSERLAEAAKRVRAELADDTPAASPPALAAKPAAAPTQPRRDPAAAVQQATRAQPSTLSDIPSGTAPVTEVSGLPQFMKMSDDDILNALAKGT